MAFEYLDHTADVKIRASGKSFADACSHAARATTNLLTDVNLIKPNKQHSVLVKGGNKDQLLVDFLNELIYLKDTSGFVVCSAMLSQNDKGLVGTLYGDDIANYERSGDIKAATLHELKIEEKDGVTVLEFILDI